MIEGHGDDRYRYGDIRADFSSNVPAGIDHRALYDFLRERLTVVEHYPEPEPFTLERALAERHGIGPESVLATNGATEALYLTAHLTAGATTEIVQPTFAEYADACRLYEHYVSSVEAPWHPTGRTLWCCNPNNPTGRTLNRAELLLTIDAHAETIFVVDQSYASFTPHPTLTAAEATARKNLVLIHSMTKQYAIPGLRLGYLTAHPTLCNELRRLRMPWSVHALAIEAGCYLLEYGVPTPPLPDLLAETHRVAEALQATGRFAPYPTDTHFMTVEIRRTGTAAELKEWLASHHGILIRDASNFEGLTPHHFRIATQTPLENELLIEALKTWSKL